MTTQTPLRQYTVTAHSTHTFGRVLCSVRTNHFIADGPVANGCPGEALSPAELFLSGVAACGVELVQVLARNQGIALQAISAAIQGQLAGARAAQPDVALFNSVRLQFTLQGVTTAQGAQLIEGFKRR